MTPDDDGNTDTGSSTCWAVPSTGMHLHFCKTGCARNGALHPNLQPGWHVAAGFGLVHGPVADGHWTVTTIPLSDLSLARNSRRATLHDMRNNVVLQPEAQQLLERYALPTVAWPKPEAADRAAERVRDHYRGCLLWGAVGDALGRVAERKSPSEIRVRFGPDGPTEYIPWRGWKSGPTGTITDDTQLTMEVARSIIHSDGQFDPEDFSRRLIDWLPVGRGKVGPRPRRSRI